MTKAFRWFVGHTLHFDFWFIAKETRGLAIAPATHRELFSTTWSTGYRNRIDGIAGIFTLQALGRAVRERSRALPEPHRAYLAPDRPVTRQRSLVVEHAIITAATAQSGNRRVRL